MPRSHGGHDGAEASRLLAPAFSMAAVLPIFRSKFLLVCKTFTTKEPDLLKPINFPKLCNP